MRHVSAPTPRAMSTLTQTSAKNLNILLRTKFLGRLEPPNVFSLLLVQSHGIDEIAHCTAHSQLGQILIECLLNFVVQIFKLGTIVAADAVLLLSICECFHIANDVTVVFTCLCATIK